MIRKAMLSDLDGIERIYDALHDLEERGLGCTGWLRSVYPTRSTACASIEAGDMFVFEKDGEIVASGRINRDQVDVYADVGWKYTADDSEVMVLHTLAVHPGMSGKGIGTEFVRFYEQYALENGCPVLRIDTNERNLPARSLYKKLGYREAETVPCVFNGIPGVGLVCLEKRADGKAIEDN